MLNDAQIDVLRRELTALMDPAHPRDLFYEYHSNESADPARTLFHALGAWRVSPAFHDLLWNPAFLVPASQLLGGPVRFWHDQLFCKPARHGGVVAWHQDYSYWTRAYPAGHVTCWIALDDATLENGCVHYVPGSHRWGLLPRISLTKDMDAVRRHLEPEQAEAFRPEPVPVRAGECLFHHSHTVHGSYGNRSDGPRRGVVLNFMKPDTRCAGGETPLLAGVPLVARGAVIEGPFFPLL
jgi:ectoine hydroxylase-related dioxygenase (phytanoyl-CoA dioxygenase family)